MPPMSVHEGTLFFGARAHKPAEPRHTFNLVYTSQRRGYTLNSSQELRRSLFGRQKIQNFCMCKQSKLHSKRRSLSPQPTMVSIPKHTATMCMRKEARSCRELVTNRISSNLFHVQRDKLEVSLDVQSSNNKFCGWLCISCSPPREHVI
jgi:hypothetical protein